MERYKRKRVMDDDEYDVMLERIVEKTFFPEMQRMRDRRAFMEAVETGDHAEMQRIQAVYTDMTPSRPYDTPATPHAGSATPLPEDLPVQAHPAPTQIIGRQQRQSDDGLPSLDEFLQKNTPEEDASFSMIKQNDRAELARKWAWANKNQPLQLTAPEGVRQIADGSRKSYPAEGGALVEAGSNALQTTSGDGAVVRNSRGAIMTVARSGVCEPAAPPMGPPKTLNLRALRGYREDVPEQRHPAPPSRSSSTASSAGNALLATPIITPGMGGGSTPLMTWGQVEGTPLVLAADPDEVEGGRQFEMLEEDEREKVAKKMAQAAAKRMKAATTGIATAANTPLHAKLMAKAGLTPQRGGGGAEIGGTPVHLAAAATPKRSDIFSKSRRLTPADLARARSAASVAPTPKRRKSSKASQPPTPRRGSATDDLLL